MKCHKFYKERMASILTAFEFNPSLNGIHLWGNYQRAYSPMVKLCILIYIYIYYMSDLNSSWIIFLYIIFFKNQQSK